MVMIFSEVFVFVSVRRDPAWPKDWTPAALKMEMDLSDRYMSQMH